MSPTLLRRTLIVVVTAIVLVAVALFAARIPHTIAIFLIAAFIAFGALPLVTRLEQRMPRPLAIALVYAALMSALVLLALVVIPISYAQILALVGHTPEYLAWSGDVVRRSEGALRHLLGNRVPLPSYTDMQAQAGLRLSAFVTAAVASLGTIVVGAFTALLIAVSALILSVFFLLQGGGVRDGILAFVPPRRRASVGALLQELTAVFGHFVAGQVLLCGIVGAAVWLLLFPTHFAFALLVAVICALGYAVPFVGMLVAQIAAALLAVPQGTGMVIWVTVAIFVVARLADNVLTPKIMEKSVGVSPITVMFAVFAGGELFGFPGLIFGIPAAALLKVLFGYFVQPYVVRMQSREAAEPAVEAEAVVVSVKLGPS
ncbi:MAG TPA: AI-2E family transporter [Candidatus Elarobacter sp.]